MNYGFLPYLRPPHFRLLTENSTLIGNTTDIPSNSHHSCYHTNLPLKSCKGHRRQLLGFLIDRHGGKLIRDKQNTFSYLKEPQLQGGIAQLHEEPPISTDFWISTCSPQNRTCNLLNVVLPQMHFY